MNIAIVGTGYVGLVTGVCFSEMGNRVTCVDTDVEKIENLKNGVMPIYEPGLEEMVQRGQREGVLCFTTELAQALERSSVCFIAVGTPMDRDGSADLRYVLQVAADVGRHMTGELSVVNKSTVPVGTAALVRDAIQRELDARGVSHPFRVISNPEFLKEGSAIADCMRPDRVVIGAPDQESVEIMRELYDPFVRNSDRFIIMDVASAEMTKYAANAMLATRISFMNEIAGICERVGADVNKVRLGIGSDSRIGYSFLYAGCGYGGSCFPKDVQALIRTAREHGCSHQVLESVEEVNRRQKLLLVDKVVERFGQDLTGRRFAVWGLAFKPNTDDVREAPSVVIIRELVRRGAQVSAYDPKAAREARETYLRDLDVDYVESKYTCLNGADAMLLVTEWKEFRSPDFYEMQQRMKSPVIFDGRNQYTAPKMRKQGFEYHPVGAPAAMPLVSSQSS